jgi:hypothetical protein
MISPVQIRLYLIFRCSEDLRLLVYKSRMRLVDILFAVYKNLVHIATHEHGLLVSKPDTMMLKIKLSRWRL